MAIEILMPALSPTMEKGNLAKWYVKEGDKVTSGDVIAEIETDKAIMEVEAVDDGYIGKILVPEGTADIPINQLIAILLEDGETLADVVPVSAISTNDTVSSSVPASVDVSLHVTPENTVLPQCELISLHDRVLPELVTSVSATVPSSEGSQSGRSGRIFVSPLARRIARERGIDLKLLGGSGPHGRIIMRDVEQAGICEKSKDLAAKSNQFVTPVENGMTDEQIKDMYKPDCYEEVPHDKMREIIASRLVESKQTVPHFYLTADCQLDAMLDLRSKLNIEALQDEAGTPAYKLSVNDFVVKAMALALRDVPLANATWTKRSKLLHKHSDVGVAVAIPNGLFTPIVRKAELKTLSSISNEIKSFVKRAHAKKLKPEEYQGGSTDVSNLGMYGINNFHAVINPPHGTILAVGACEQRPVVRNGEIVVAQIMSVTLSCDHRVVDGAIGADLLRSFKTLIEHPMRLLI